MIIFDNSVLSSFERLKLLSRLKQLLKSGIISREVHNEYSIQWQKKIPKWIKILQPKEYITLESPPLSLSSADLSLIKLSLEYKVPIATDHSNSDLFIHIESIPNFTFNNSSNHSFFCSLFSFITPFVN
ncbi:MAG: hypothetical protein EU548_04885 [Promethearchaeota archaeon]|nr:MAG: hypothetical protein EU548_04885 [Candidatus Lokiarchaeota archaeon]